MDYFKKMEEEMNAQAELKPATKIVRKWMDSLRQKWTVDVHRVDAD